MWGLRWGVESLSSRCWTAAPPNRIFKLQQRGFHNAPTRMWRGEGHWLCSVIYWHTFLNIILITIYCSYVYYALVEYLYILSVMDKVYKSQKYYWNVLLFYIFCFYLSFFFKFNVIIFSQHQKKNKKRHSFIRTLKISKYFLMVMILKLFFHLYLTCLWPPLHLKWTFFHLFFCDSFISNLCFCQSFILLPPIFDVFYFVERNHSSSLISFPFPILSWLSIFEILSLKNIFFLFFFTSSFLYFIWSTLFFRV